jgi:hypothetical protein
MATLQYILKGGQLFMEKTAFTRELLLPDSMLKIIVYGKGNPADIPPKVGKEGNLVKIDFNQAEVRMDEGFYDLFRKLKGKYREKIMGRAVIQITALTSYHVTLNLNNEDDKVVYE